MNRLCFTGCNQTNSEGQYDENSNCPFWPFITAFTESDDKTRTLCLFMQKIDAVRGVHFETYPTKDEVDMGIYNAWFGKEVSTPDQQQYVGENHSFSHINTKDSLDTTYTQVQLWVSEAFLSFGLDSFELYICGRFSWKVRVCFLLQQQRNNEHPRSKELDIHSVEYR